MTRNGLLKLLIPALGVALAGCPSMPLNQTASTVPAGEFQQGVGVEYYGCTGCGVDISDDGEVTNEGIAFFNLPFPNWFGRYGISDNIDLGFRFSAPFSVGFDMKFQVLDTEVLDLAIDPGIQYNFALTYFHLPVLIGLPMGDFFELVLSPRVTYMTVTGDEGSTSLGSAGLFVGGGAAMIFKFDAVQISPELHFLYNPEVEESILSFNVGFAWTGSHDVAVVEAAPAAAPAAYVAPAPAPPAGGVTVEVQ